MAKLNHIIETQIVNYCAGQNIELNQANAYQSVMDCFKDNPVCEYNESGEKGKDITKTLAWEIETSPRTLERIIIKIQAANDEITKSKRTESIASAKRISIPDLNKLVENLTKLNIVDGQSYMALVCFLMQLKHTRDGEIAGDDKTCVFFNGVARNGKSETAKAICKIEEKYGDIQNVTSGKVLESPHAERVWKSHLNYFDEVKPSDLDRELLLKITNGGLQEINPKGKDLYQHYVKTNNIFTSNDQINLKQRRVSVIKFGQRLNGRPLAPGTMENIISAIFESLPNFDKHYYDIYYAVSLNNEKRINPLATETLATFLYASFEESATHSENFCAIPYINFTTHDIYNLVKRGYNKQIITSERKEATRYMLDYFVKKNLIDIVPYDSTTTHYKVTRENYERIREEFESINTSYEKIDKISIDALTELFRPYFDNYKPEPAEKSAPDFIPFKKTEKGFVPSNDGEFEMLNRPLSTAPTPGHKTFRSQDNCELSRFMLESDTLTLDEQKAFVDRNKNIIMRAVFSGKKSIHCIFQLSPSRTKLITNVSDYKLFRAELVNYLGQTNSADPATKDPCRLTRRPNVIRSDTGTMQELLHYAPDVFIPDDVADNLYERAMAKKTKALKILPPVYADSVGGKKYEHQKTWWIQWMMGKCGELCEGNQTATLPSILNTQVCEIFTLDELHGFLNQSITPDHYDYIDYLYNHRLGIMG